MRANANITIFSRLRNRRLFCHLQHFLASRKPFSVISGGVEKSASESRSFDSLCSLKMTSLSFRLRPQDALEELKEYNKFADIKVLTARLGFKSALCSEILSFIKDSFMLPEPARLQAQADGIFKKSAKAGKDPRMIMSWMLLAKHFAYSSNFKADYDESRIDELITKISSILHANTDTINRLKSTFADYGILFGIVHKVEGASIDGYSFDCKGNPCIVVTTRFGRIDNLAFAVMHELGHIKNHDNEDRRVNIEGYDHESTEEKAANAFAANALIPDSVWKKIPKVQLYPAQIQRLYTEWAQKNGYNKWIALGRIRHETGMFKFRNDTSRRIS